MKRRYELRVKSREVTYVIVEAGTTTVAIVVGVIFWLAKTVTTGGVTVTVTGAAATAEHALTLGFPATAVLKYDINPEAAWASVAD